MDEDVMRDWGYYTPFINGRDLNFPAANLTGRDTKPFINGRDPGVVSNGAYHSRDCSNSEEADIPTTYVRDGWENKFISIAPYGSLPEPSHSLQILQPQGTDERIIEETPISKKRQVATTHKEPKPKKAKKPKDDNNPGIQRVKPAKKSLEVVIKGIQMDISSIPIPVCSCTGNPQQCYRWGCGGWQSACCTTNVSMYPLPMSTKRRGARIAGRKMSQGAFKKVMEKLAEEGYDFTNSIDLKTHWARHGTNKFVTIR